MNFPFKMGESNGNMFFIFFLILFLSCSSSFPFREFISTIPNHILKKYAKNMIASFKRNLHESASRFDFNVEKYSDSTCNQLDIQIIGMVTNPSDIIHTSLEGS